jgi:serine beta-lactamase-like protein LACTB
LIQREVGLKVLLSARSWYRGASRPLILGLLALLPVVSTAEPVAPPATVLVPEPLTTAHMQAVNAGRERVRAWMAEKNLPGVSVAVGIDGGLVWAEGFGWADLEQRVAVTPLTRFRIGSTSKGLTSAAVGLLHDRGVLKLDAPARTYVTSFPEKPWPISTRQLMGHVAGIRHYQGDEPFSSRHYDTVVQSLDIFAADPLKFEPGTRYSYSTYGWNLVSAVVESAAGEPFLEFMRREVFAPIGMRDTIPDDAFMIVPGRTRFYARDPDGRLRNERAVDQSNKWAGGGFLSTPSDLIRFGFAMLDAKLLKRETVELLWTPLRLQSGEETDYGLGWLIGKTGGHAMVASPGSSIGGTTAFAIFPEQGMVVSVMSNVTGAEVRPLWQALAPLFLGEGRPDASR